MCPEFGIDIILKRPDNDPPDETTVSPGAHGFGADQSAYSVVWWDCRTLELGITPPSASANRNCSRKAAMMS
jgi:hypothetical protein